VSDNQTNLMSFSDALADAVASASNSVARIEARPRQPASGIVWQADGLILTADHVLERDEDVQVGLPDGRSVSATIVGRDPGTDLALLRAEATNLTPIERAPEARTGQVVLIVARPGSAPAASLGIINLVGGPVRTGRGGQLERFIRTDASFLPGFSGGPLIDAAGRLLGLATSHFGRGGGLAIPVETLDRVSTALLAHGRIRRGFLGLGSQSVALPSALRERHGLSQESGLLVVGVEPGGPAEKAGLLLGDLLIKLANDPIRDTGDLRAALGSDRVGQTVLLRVLRGGEPVDLTVTIGERE
jgi:S1-C subfamily serine protease